MNETQIMIMELAGKGYSCAQIVVLGGLRLMGRDNPDLVRAMAGLAQGVGCSGEICGALSGGVCLLAMHSAKGMDDEDSLPSAQPLMDAMVEWFREFMCNGGPMTCDAILTGVHNEHGASVCAMDPRVCGTLVCETWTKAVSMLVEVGIDPSLGRDLK